MNEELKRLIKEKLLSNCNKIQGLRARLFTKKYYKQYQEIINLTTFLSENASFTERIYCIYNDVNFIKKCVRCKRELKFLSFMSGYKECNCLIENGIILYGTKKSAATKKAKGIGNDGLTVFQRAGKKASKKIKQSLNKIESNGFTVAQNRGKTCSKTKKLIESNGLTRAQNSGKKLSKTLKLIQLNGFTIAQNRGKLCSLTKNLIESNGLTRAQNRANKAAETKRIKGIGEDGLTVFQRAGLKSRKTRKQIGSDGLTITQRLVKKMVKTMSKIGEDGLTGFERAFKNGAGKNTKLQYHSSGLCYQGLLERKFLDLVSETGFIKNICKIKPFNYEYKNTTHLYHPDFNYKNILFEIKSCWTYDNNGKNIELRKINHLKWLAALSRKYKLYVIWDNKWLSILSTKDFDDIEKSLYSTKTLFTKQSLIDIFKTEI